MVFREALRANPHLVQRYAALKQRLAAQHVNDREAYTAGKADFIAHVLEE
ncbi:MAG: GrpB family protein [Ornithinimicrobium sp.]